MDLIREKTDISKKVLEIDIDSPIFEDMLENLNREILRVVEKVYEEEFEAGEITVKLALTIPTSYKDYPAKNEFGEMVNKTFSFRKPHFEHKITTNLKKQFKQEGLYTEEKEVVFKDGKFVAMPIQEPQTSLFDNKNQGGM
ncbi:hypothetical protein GOQ27_06940 [Clostridium sp. D2Q-11]|uniref:Uncharacterized protein n=1 Tax=Anaeromonas frigoriresistens TaxID=2683708 RepID=A0A942Z716_9FIRM|nr:hypothetical protein [Anaeromonas frigoriresistens]MBS4538192.1 hypothetical protein [Anaeromonas frigoriresistens]